MVSFVTAPTSGCIDQPAAVSNNRIFRKCKAGIISYNQPIMSDVKSIASGISPVTINARAVCFKVRGMAFNTTFMVFIKIRTC